MTPEGQKPRSFVRLEEAMVRVMEWVDDSTRTSKLWQALPIFAAREQARLSDGSHRLPLRPDSRVPPRVQRGLEDYLRDHPQLDGLSESKCAEAARRSWSRHGNSGDQLKAELFRHIDIPSLAVHCRPLIAEDVFDISDEDLWTIRETLRLAEPNSWSLEVVRLLLLVARYIAPRFGCGTTPVDDVEDEWEKTVELHERIVLGAPHPKSK